MAASDDREAAVRKLSHGRSPGTQNLKRTVIPAKAGTQVGVSLAIGERNHLPNGDGPLIERRQRRPTDLV